MGRRFLKGTILATGLVTAGYSMYKAAKEFIEYQKLKNKDIYINSDMKELSEMTPVIRSSICTGEKEAGFKDKNVVDNSWLLAENNVKK